MSKPHQNPISKIDNPCLEEQKKSFRCIEENSLDQSKCNVYFENYKNCRKFWESVKDDRIRKGILPAMPNLEEREKIKQQRRLTMSN